LLVLASLSLVPVLILVALLSLAALERERANYLGAAQARNRTLINALEAHMGGHLSALRTLAASAALERGDLQAFDAEARRVLPTQPAWRNIMLITADGRQVVNMRFPYGQFTVQGAAGEAPLIQRALATDAPVVGNMSVGPASGELGIAVRMRVRPAGHAPMVLQFILRPESFAPFILAQQYPAGWVLALADANRRFITRVPHAHAGKPVAPAFAKAMESGREGWFRGATIEGKDTYQAFLTSELTGWTIGVAMPAEEVERVAWRTAAWMALGALASLLMALAVAAWLGRRVAAPITRLADAARNLGQQEVAGQLKDVEAHAGITEVQALAAALREAHTALAEREALRDREATALRAADRAKDEFLAMLGHELRNPLSAITASAHVLRLSKPDAATANVQGVIERQARQMSRLLEDLMDVSRLAMGKVSLQLEPLDLAKVSEAVVQTWQHASTNRSGLVRLVKQPVWVLGDRARLEQVLTNLLDNALKFSPANTGIDVEVRPDPTTREALLEVRDQGQGIAAEDVPRVFDLFMQGPQSFHRPQGGIGLGLTLVRRLVELQHGQVGIHSPGPGLGTRVTVRLPQTDGPSLEPTPTPPVAEAGKGRRILLVEDNDDGRVMMESMLSLEGHEVTAVAQGRDAVEAVRRWQPDLALVDIGLPDIDGYEVARAIRAMALSVQPKLIALTGYGQPEDQRRAYEAGFDLHLTKPVTPAFLRDVMHALTTRQSVGPSR
jgi:signal transduction histidine kinase/ActR/RegA family two-component response regulator